MRALGEGLREGRGEIAGWGGIAGLRAAERLAWEVAMRVAGCVGSVVGCHARDRCVVGMGGGHGE
jgi:hypothetical protein